jgi:phenylpropionate dioxygenase-like ring-hydroxylating dioxygenase large terminal subunit
MIPNQWYAVLDTKEVKTGKPVGVTRMGEKLVFWRDVQGRVSCLRDQCPHRGAALSKGKIHADLLACPFHGFQFDVTGQCSFIPANGRAASFPKQMKVWSYPTFEAHGFIFIYWGAPPQELKPPRFFDNLEGMVYAGVRVPFNAHYSRAIENQLDVAHLPFVHYDTIGRGGRTLVDGPLVEWDGDDKFNVYVFNRLDDGSPPRKPREMIRPAVDFHLEFIFPNLWQNYLGLGARIMLAFTPVDEEHSLLYLRFYQKPIPVPILRELLPLFTMPLNLHILNQDRRVVETQRPLRSDLKMGEKLIQADHPIVLYRQHRQALIGNQSQPA